VTTQAYIHAGRLADRQAGRVQQQQDKEETKGTVLVATAHL